MRTESHTNKLISFLKVLLSSLTNLFTSCSTNTLEKIYLSDMGINLADKFEVISSSNSASIGDQLVEFKLKVSDKDYLDIKTKIESEVNFQIINDNETPNRSYTGPNKEVEITAWKRNETYSYEIKKNRPSGYENYILILLPDNSLTFKYADE